MICPGSSPLARGTVLIARHGFRAGRFIPAGAGNSRLICRDRPAIPVHPRWRGEQLPNVMSPSGVNGSSPLARGTAAVLDFDDFHCRFIPAGAGNRLQTGAASRLPSVHPRWRGEQEGIHQAMHKHCGSSPLARGTACKRGPPHQQLRFIPAGAGNSERGCPGIFRAAVHPRWRGEQLPAARPGQSSVRFIPAGAGNRRRPAPAHRAAPVHPRWRGEQPRVLPQSSVVIGSSPLARGTGW